MCLCAELQAALYVDRQSPSFLASLTEISTGNWVKLCRCESCGQLWRVDEWDKYQTQMAIKIPELAGWETYDAKPLELALLIESRGGLSEKQCLWAGCARLAVKGVVYCPEHLYETGARR